MPVLKYKDPVSGSWVVLPAIGPAGPPGPAGKYDDNLFTNAEFENWDSSGQANGWTAFWHVPGSPNPQPVIGPTSTQGCVYQGVSAWQTFFPAYAGGDAVQRIWPITAIQCAPGGTYYTSCYTRAQDINTGGLELIVISAPPGVDPNFFVSGTTIQNPVNRTNIDTTYRKYEAVFTVGASDVSMRVGWSFGARGDSSDRGVDKTIYSDTFVLKRLDMFGPVPFAGSGSALTASHSDHTHPPGLNLTPPNRQVFTASGTWTKPAGALWVLVQVCGGGGAGGGASATGVGEWTFGDGGGGGEYAELLTLASAVGVSEAIVVGAAGAGASGAAGGNGGLSSFGTAGTLVSAAGGGGGAIRPNTSTAGFNYSNNNALRAGGSGGTGGGIRVPGGNGGSGMGFGAGGLQGKGGDGGTSRFSGGALGQAATAPTAAGGWGGGGAGLFSVASQAARVGGNGSPGVVIVTSYFQ